MKRSNWIKFIFIILIFAFALLVDIPKGPNFKIGNWQKEIKVHTGLDLQGGTHLVYELDTSKIDSQDKEDAALSVEDVIRKRVDALGVSEPVIQSTQIGDTQNVIVELPGITNITQAVDLIGQTAQLNFWEMDETLAPKEENQNEFTPGWKETELNGSNLKKAEVKFDQNTGNPYISIAFNSDGAKLFGEITQRNIGKPLAIVLDNQIISAPTVQDEISSGEAVITGQFTVEDARNLTKLLNAGALPVPIKIVEQRNIGATLGINSVKTSLLAGIIGLLLVIIFMIAIYKIPGLFASFALIIYGSIVLALIKLIPITLTLAGVAGFIVSFGMAVDANVLIFARMKEELLKKDVPKNEVIKIGFDRAFSSIFDSNISTLITCVILYFMTTGLVRGFAVTLGIGILVSMFSAIFITRTLLNLLVNTKLEKYLNM